MKIIKKKYCLSNNVLYLCCIIKVGVADFLTVAGS